MPILIENIKELVQVENLPALLVKGRDMAKMETVKDAFLFIKNEKIEQFGKMAELDKQAISSQNPGLEIIDVKWFFLPSSIRTPTSFTLPAAR